MCLPRDPPTWFSALVVSLELVVRGYKFTMKDPNLIIATFSSHFDAKINFNNKETLVTRNLMESLGMFLNYSLLKDLL